MTMKAVAEKAGVCERTVEKYENGMIKDERCNLEVLIGLARALVFARLCHVMCVNNL